MSKPLPITDFRALRYVLEAHEYAFGGEELPPTDLVEPTIWDASVHLPDDIAVRISNHHGKELKLLCSLWQDWLQAMGDRMDGEDTLFDGMLDAADCFQCANFNLLHGYPNS